jgi:hypothetical protein
MSCGSGGVLCSGRCSTFDTCEGGGLGHLTSVAVRPKTTKRLVHSVQLWVNRPNLGAVNTLAGRVRMWETVLVRLV